MISAETYNKDYDLAYKQGAKDFAKWLRQIHVLNCTFCEACVFCLGDFGQIKCEDALIKGWQASLVKDEENKERR